MLRLRICFSCIALTLVLSAGTTASASPESWVKEINQLTQDDATHPIAPRGTVFVGSSSIRMWKSLSADFPGRPLVNRGFGGSELADSVHYFDRLVQPYRPAVVVLYAGDNDIADGKSPERVLADFRAFRAKLHRALPDTWLVYLSIKECPARAVKRTLVREANRLIAADCQQAEHCRYVDVTTPLQHPDGSFRTELFLPDGLHLDPAGYAIWTHIVQPVLDQLAPLP